MPSEYATVLVICQCMCMYDTSNAPLSYGCAQNRYALNNTIQYYIEKHAHYNIAAKTLAAVLPPHSESATEALQVNYCLVKAAQADPQVCTP